MANRKSAARVIKKIGSSHVVWFPESNRWVEFREPAWFVYKQHLQGADEQTITGLLTQRYGLPSDEAGRFFCEIIDGIHTSSLSGFNPAPGLLETGICTRDKARKFKTRHYLVNKKHITISYGSPDMEFYIHRPLAWLETQNAPPGSLHLEVLTAAQPPGFRHQPNSRDTGEQKTGQKIYCISRKGETQHVFNDAGMLKHRLYVEATSHIYGIPGQDWMSYIHASAVTNGREAILLSSASGSGKSTMAALLQLPADKSRPGRQDIFFMSDDFVPVDATGLKAFAFPAALNVKEGSFPVIEAFYHHSDDADRGYSMPGKLCTRFLRPRFPARDPYEPRAVKKIIFIRYTPQAGFKMERLPVIKALSMFHEEAWVSHNPGHAQRFIDWFAELECYRLEYSDNKTAVEAVGDLFD
jgi:hypothetical protein